MTDDRSHDGDAAIEPVEIQHVKLHHALFGYRRGDVDELLERVTASYEDAWYEREALRERLERLLDELERFRERERLMGDVVRNAQRVADEAVAEARETADRVLVKARKRADELILAAERDPERLRDDLRALAAAETALHERVRLLLARGDGAPADGAARIAEEPEPGQSPVAPAT